MESERKDPTAQIFRGTQVRDDGTGPVLVSHRQKLLVVAGPDRGAEIEVEGTHLTIGTAPTNDLKLTDQTVSRRHCEISVRNEKYFIRDLESTNGTQLNGTLVIEGILSPGSRVRLGDTEMVFEPKKKWERVTESEEPQFGELKGKSVAMRSVFSMLQKVASTDLSCVIVGETGTGKELAARGIHDRSARKSHPFIIVDCGAVSKNLVSSELFGHEKGAFTGADKLRIGAFEASNGGTIFLDEIGELPLDLQPALLRALERREIKRLGATKHIEVNVRVVAATHRDLPAMIEKGEFREDLYYRLAEVEVALPPLRERLDDVEVIVNAMLEEHAKEGVQRKTIDQQGMRWLMMQPWPGNVRELRNVLRRVLAMSNGSTITLDDFSAMSSGTSPGRMSIPPASPTSEAGGPIVSSEDVAEGLPIKDAREKWIMPMEREYLVRLMRRCSGDLNAASNDAGVHRKSLERLLRQHGLKTTDWK
jgi:DNA-binding NtrC family response regulator